MAFTFQSVTLNASAVADGIRPPKVAIDATVIDRGIRLPRLVLDASYRFTTLSAEYFPQGGVRIQGVPAILDSIQYIPRGGVRFGGKAVFPVRSGHTPIGGVRLGGRVLFGDHKATGGVRLGGASVTVGHSRMFAHTPTGGVRFGGTKQVNFSFSIKPSGGVRLGGTTIVNDKRPGHVATGGVRFGGTTTVGTLAPGESITPENPYNLPFNAWAVNFETGATSRYSKFPMTSLCTFKGLVYGVNAAGVYKLDGEADQTQPIKASVIFSNTDMGTQRNKRVPNVYIGIRSKGHMQLRTVVNARENRYYAFNAGADVRGVRVNLGKGLNSRYWQFAIQNVDGAPFEIDSIGFTPDILARAGV